MIWSSQKQMYPDMRDGNDDVVLKDVSLHLLYTNTYGCFC